MNRWLWAALMATALSLPFMAQPPDDSDRLGMALEYFQSGKYHEALLLFEQLDKTYALNPRYHAYMGVCHYYEWEYEEACRYLDDAIPQLEAFAPHERSVYYFTNGESHFQLKQYAQAIPYFEKALTVCFENEKGDIHYRLGMCHMFAEEWQAASNHYRSALDNYVALRNTPDMQPRIYQTSHMMKGCEDKLKANKSKVMEMGTAVAENDTPSPSTEEEPAVPPTVDSVEMVTTSIPSPITLPAISFTGDHTTPPPPRIDVSATVGPQETAKGKLVRDTLHHDIPQTINIQDIFNRQVEVKDEK